MSILISRGWDLKDNCSEEDKKRIIKAVNDRSLSPWLRFTALYIAIQAEFVSFGKFEEVCDEIGLFNDDLGRLLTELALYLDV
jgi:hypothetical protein